MPTPPTPAEASLTAGEPTLPALLAAEEARAAQRARLLEEQAALSTPLEDLTERQQDLAAQLAALEVDDARARALIPSVQAAALLEASERELARARGRLAEAQERHSAAEGALADAQMLDKLVIDGAPVAPDPGAAARVLRKAAHAVTVAEEEIGRLTSVQTDLRARLEAARQAETAAKDRQQRAWVGGLQAERAALISRIHRARLAYLATLLDAARWNWEHRLWAGKTPVEQLIATLAHHIDNHGVHYKPSATAPIAPIDWLNDELGAGAQEALASKFPVLQEAPEWYHRQQERWGQDARSGEQ